MIVIDTHALIWLYQGDSRLGGRARRSIDGARESSGVLIPAIMTWEVAMLVDKDRVVLGLPPGIWFARVLQESGFRLAGLDVAIGIDAGTLPGGFHGDPADRLIIATARSMRFPLLTADEKILDYAKRGHVDTIDARF